MAVEPSGAAPGLVPTKFTTVSTFRTRLPRLSVATLPTTPAGVAVMVEKPPAVKPLKAPPRVNVPLSPKWATLAALVWPYAAR